MYLCYWPPGQEKSVACQEQHKLFGKSLFPLDLPAKSHYSFPTQPFIHLQTFIEQLPFLSTVGDTEMYKPTWGYKCMGSRCEHVKEQKEIWVGIPLWREWSGISNAASEHAYLVRISLGSVRLSSRGSRRDQMPCLFLGSNPSYVILGKHSGASALNPLYCKWGASNSS